MELDADDAWAWLTRWWVEAGLAVIALGALASGLWRGDLVRAALGVTLAVALTDRVRLRLDNRSLAVAVEEVRSGGVSGARRSDGTVEHGSDAAGTDSPTADEPAPDGTDGGRPDGPSPSSPSPSPDES